MMDIRLEDGGRSQPMDLAAELAIQDSIQMLASSTVVEREEERAGRVDQLMIETMFVDCTDFRKKIEHWN